MVRLVEYFDFCRNVRKLAPKTFNEYKRVMGVVSKHISIWEVSGPSEIDDAIISLAHQEGWSERYAYKYSKILKPFYDWAFYKEYTPKHLYPYSKIRKPKPAQAKFLTEPEFDFVREIAEKSPVINSQDLLILNLMWDTGLRRSEIASLDISEIDRIQNIVHLPKEKAKGGSRDRYLPYTEKTAKIANSHIEWVISLNKPFLLLNEDLLRMSAQGIYLRIQKIAKIAEMESLKPHSLRHSLGIRIIEKGGDIGFVAKLLGHESINTTLHYTNLAKQNSKSIYDRIMTA